MAVLGTISIGAFDAANSDTQTTITGTDPVLEPIASANDNEYLGDVTNTSHTSVAYFAIDSFPADLATMDTLSIELRYWRNANNETRLWDALTVHILQSDLTTPLCNEATIASNITTTTATNSGAVTLTGLNTTAGSAVWAGAVLEINYTVTKVKGGAVDNLIVSAAELTGTYTAAAAPVTINPVKSTSASTSDTAQLTVTNPPMTINPVASVSASTSDTAQLTATYLPTTVTPVGSTSASSADQAQLTIIGTINPVGSTSSSSSDTAQLTVTDTGVTINPVGSTSASSADTAQLTISWQPTTVTPVGSTSASSSDTAQLTVVDPPTTVTPIGSSSASNSDTGQLVSPGTPLAITDLAGNPGISGEVTLTWSEPVGVQ